MDHFLLSRRQLVICLGVLFVLTSLGAQESREGQDPGPSGLVKPWIVVTVPASSAGDPLTETLALVVADTIEMTLRLIGDYEVRSRPERGGEALVVDAEAAADLAEDARMDYVVYGEVAAVTETEIRFRLSVYSRETGSVTLEREAVAQSLFDTFYVADELSAELLGAFTGQRIAYGQVNLRNQAELPGAYRVFLDGTPVGTSIGVLERVLIGERLVDVVALEGPAAGTTVASERMVVTEGGSASVTFVAEGVPEPEPDPEPPVAAAPPPSDASAPVAAPAPVIRIPDEPEIPLDWRVYPWRRSEREGELVFTGTVLAGNSVRSNQAGTSEYMMRSQLQMDWGTRSVGLMAIEHNSWSRATVDQLDASAVAASNLSFGTSARSDRLTAGYGARLRPLRFLSFSPIARLSIEREIRLFTYVGSDGTIQTYSDSDLSGSKEDPFSAILWSVLPGFELIAESHIRRFTIQAIIGAHMVIPTTASLSGEVSWFDWTTNTTQSARVESDTAAAFEHFMVLGAGYAWGGSESQINDNSDSERPFRAYPPERRRVWRLTMQPYIAFPYYLFSAVENPVIPLPFPAIGIGLQATHKRGFFVSPFAGIGVSGTRAPVSYVSVNDSTASVQSGHIDGNGESYGVGVGCRVPLTDSLFLSAEYRIAVLNRGYDFDGVEGSTSAVALGPRFLLEHSIPGSGAVVYGGVWALATTPLGVTDYSEGLTSWDGEPISVDGSIETLPTIALETGVVVRLYGAPNRFYAASGDGKSWLAWSDAEGTATASSADAPQPGSADDRWWVPRLSAGTGIAYGHVDGRGGRSGAMTVLPAALRFPFGLEIGVQSSYPLGETGISGRLEEQEVVGTADLGTGVLGEPRVNRIVSFDLGYRFRRDQRLSWLLGFRYARMDDELWNIQNVRADGSILAADESRFARAGTVSLAGIVVEAAYALSDRFTLRVSGSGIQAVDDGYVELTPALAPTVRHKLVSGFFSTGVSLTMEL